MIGFRRIVTLHLALLASPLFILAAAQAQAPTPVQLNSALPYRVELRPYSMGAIDMPTLHSFAVGETDGKFVFVSGRTNGLHGFDLFEENFPPQFANRDVWVVDFQAKQSWRRSLDDATSGLTETQKLSLATTNNQFHQRGDTLYTTGGYGIFEDGNFGTFDTLSAIDVPGLAAWAMNGAGTAADHIRQIHSPAVQVTGGAMHEINGRTHLVMGQNFEGTYSPFGNGAYTEQVRSFDIVDDGVNLAIANTTMSTPDADYHRRDLNVVPVLRPEGVGGVTEGLVALSGVFTPTEGAWLTPVEIDSTGNPTMDDPNLPNTFRQGMNNYHSAKLGLYSESAGAMHEVLFGGISLQYVNEATQQIETDEGLPFVNDITSIMIDEQGEYSQHHLGFFPELFDQDSQRLRFGANSELLLTAGTPTFDNGVIKLDELVGETSIGFIFGGIETNAPHTRFISGARSGASNHVFEVVIITVPEPSPMAVVAGLAMGFALMAGRCRQQCENL
jgi:hypothetical protein